jgi:dCTP deaminase
MTTPVSTEAPQARTRGILPAHAIEALRNSGAIRFDEPLAADQIQPASLDLRLGAKAYRVRASFLPGPARAVAERLDQLSLHEIDLRPGAVLETGCVYIAPLIESLELPAGIAAAANPKSSTGRLDIFTRVITDHAREFDTVAEGYAGPLYAEISPRTFPCLVRMGSRLSQIRFRRLPVAQSDAGLALSVDLEGQKLDGPIGFRAKRHSGLIDVDRKEALEVEDFWDPIWPRGSLILDPGQFYILASREWVRVPPDQAAEMVPFNPLVGEFRVHYAGFFDPGFGDRSGGGEGARAVLEVRSHEVPFVLEHGQLIGRLIYEPLTEPPARVYGQGIGSNYQRQGLKLSKHFRPFRGARRPEA